MPDATVPTSQKLTEEQKRMVVEFATPLHSDSAFSPLVKAPSLPPKSPPIIAQIATLVVQPALRAINLYSRAAELLVLGTGAHESAGYSCIAQVGGGPALGYWQMEPATHNDLWGNWLRFHSEIGGAVRSMVAPAGIGAGDGFPIASQLPWNARYAAAMCRVHYFRSPFTLPTDEPTALQLANIWKTYYNTSRGAGTATEFIDNYNRYVLGYQLSTRAKD